MKYKSLSVANVGRSVSISRSHATKCENVECILTAGIDWNNKSCNIYSTTSWQR